MCDLNSKEETLECLTVNYLEKTYRDNVKKVKEFALKEVNSIDMVIPHLNRVCIQDKANIIKLLTSVRSKFGIFVLDVKPAIISIAVVIDTVTCLLGNSTFYTSVQYNNKRIFDLIIDLLQIIWIKLPRCSDSSHDFDKQQMQSLIKILESSAKRVESETKYYYNMLAIINNIKASAKSDFEKTIHNVVNDNNNLQQNYKTAILHDKNNISSENNSKENKTSSNTIDRLLDNKVKQVQMPGKEIKKSELEVNMKKPLISKQLPSEKKKLNAFELMMMSAKSKKKLV